MKRLLVAREAQVDIREAVTWLRGWSEALPDRFRAELERIYSHVVEYPEMYPPVYRRFRRALLRKFPYSVFYIVEDDAIVIMGVVHQARHDSVWKSRA